MITVVTINTDARAWLLWTLIDEMNGWMQRKDLLSTVLHLRVDYYVWVPSETVPVPHQWAWM